MTLIAVCRTCSFMRWKHVAASFSSFLTGTASKHTAVQQQCGQAGSADDQFTVFYRFPYIVAARFIQRLKLYQTGVVVAGIPVTAYFYKTGAVGFDACLGVGAVSTLALVMLYIFANFFQRVVGLVAISDDRKLVRLSHLTFFGGRNDVIVPVDDIVSLSDIDERAGDAFVKIRRYSTSDTLYVTLLYGQIENAETFRQVFGVI